jgi:hypothetical protein
MCPNCWIQLPAHAMLDPLDLGQIHALAIAHAGSTHLQPPGAESTRWLPNPFHCCCSCRIHAPATTSG